MNSQVILIAIALLSFFLTFYINRSKIDKKVKYLLIAAIFGVVLLSICTSSLNLFNNASDSAVNISSKNLTDVLPSPSSRVSIFISSIFPSYISLDDMNSLEGWKIQHQEGATGTVHLDNSSYGIDMDYDLGANTSFEMSKRKGFSIFGEDINKVKKK